MLNQASALDQIPKGERGPLHGLAVAIKDVMNTNVAYRILIVSNVADTPQTCPLRWALQSTKDTSRALIHLLLAFSELLVLSFSVCFGHQFLTTLSDQSRQNHYDRVLRDQFGAKYY